MTVVITMPLFFSLFLLDHWAQDIHGDISQMAWHAIALLTHKEAEWNVTPTDTQWRMPWISQDWDGVCPWPALLGASYEAC